MADTPQQNYQSGQNYAPDITKMFKDFVTGGNTPGDNEPGENLGIDDIRADISVSTTGSKTSDLIKALNLNPDPNAPPAPTPNTTTPVPLAQESRCHAFYRIIGFPVVTIDQSDFYNPGHDVIMQTDSSGAPIARQMTLAKKITIAQNVGSAFEALSQAREAYVAGCLSVFSVPESVEAGVLTLTSGTYGKSGVPNLRKFNAPFANNQSLTDYSISSQAYSVPGDISSTYSLVGSNTIPLNQYMDALGNTPNPAAGNYKVLSQHEHIIKPFAVDPRIDFSTWTNESKTFQGLSKRVAVPFVPDSTYLKTSATAYAQRPLIEKIISDRVSQYTVEDAGQATQDMIDYVQSIKSIQSVQIGTTSISNIFSGSVFKTSEQDAFVQYLSIIEALIFKLVDSMRIVHAAQGEYYWLPTPSTSGPENGCTTHDVPLTKATLNLLTEKDQNIALSEAATLFSNITTAFATPTATPDVGGFAFGGFFNQGNPPQTFSSASSDSQGNLSSQTNEDIVAARNSKLKKASDALQVIEMIMGEFSGLGLVDIIAVVGSLYVMPLADLLGFLDTDAYARAQTALGSNLPAKTSSISSCMVSLGNTVSGFYQIMDKLLQDYIGNNALP